MFAFYCSNNGKCNELGWVCVPLVVESYGAWGKEALESISQLTSRLATCSSKAKSVVLTELYGQLNLHITSAILSRSMYHVVYRHSLRFVYIVYSLCSLVARYVYYNYNYMGSFPRKGPNACFFKISKFGYSRSLKCPLHTASYALRIGVSVTEL